jgi:hypothetical protein
MTDAVGHALQLRRQQLSALCLSGCAFYRTTCDVTEGSEFDFGKGLVRELNRFILGLSEFLVRLNTTQTLENGSCRICNGGKSLYNEGHLLP